MALASTSSGSSGPRYERLHFAVSQADEGEASIVTGALNSQGIRRVADCNGSVDRLLGALDTEIVDMLVYDFDMMRDRFVDLMQVVRKKARGRNPFIIIVATVNDTDAETVRRLGRAGVDDLIRKPVTGHHLIESMRTLMQRRKPFLVQHDYVGPSRRVDAKFDQLDAGLLFDAPNTMRSRAIDNVSEEELERIVDKAVSTLRDKQLLACGAEIDVLARQVMEGFAQAKNSPERLEQLRKVLGRLEATVDDLRERCRGTEYERIGDLAKMMLALTQRLGRSTLTRATVEVQLVGKLAEAMRRALSTDRETSGVIRDIAATIANYTGEAN